MYEVCEYEGVCSDYYIRCNECRHNKNRYKPEIYRSYFEPVK